MATRRTCEEALLLTNLDLFLIQQFCTLPQKGRFVRLLCREELLELLVQARYRPLGGRDARVQGGDIPAERCGSLDCKRGPAEDV